jgi:hypothetical protein
METWDLYDKDRNKLNKTHIRGIPLEGRPFFNADFRPVTG